MTFTTHRSLTAPGSAPATATSRPGAFDCDATAAAAAAGHMTEDIYSTIYAATDTSGYVQAFTRPLFSLARGDSDAVGGVQGLPETSLDSGGVIPAGYLVTGWYSRVYGAPPEGGDAMYPVYAWAAAHVAVIRQGGLSRALGRVEDALRGLAPGTSTAGGIGPSPSFGAYTVRRLAHPIRLTAGQLTGELVQPAGPAPNITGGTGQAVVAVQVGLVGRWLA